MYAMELGDKIKDQNEEGAVDYKNFPDTIRLTSDISDDRYVATANSKGFFEDFSKKKLYLQLSDLLSKLAVLVQFSLKAKSQWMDISGETEIFAMELDDKVKDQNWFDIQRWLCCYSQQ